MVDASFGNLMGISRMLLLFVIFMQPETFCVQLAVPKEKRNKKCRMLL